MANDYQNALKEGRKLSKKLPRPILYRDNDIERIVQALQNKRSVLLVGAAGVGKSDLIQASAATLQQQQDRLRIREFSIAQMLSGTVYIGEWETKVTRLIEAARDSDTALYISDIWNLATAGRSSQNKNSMLDAIRPFMQNSEVQLIGELTPDMLESLQIVPQFMTFFEIIVVEPLNQEHISAIIDAEADLLQLTLETDTERRLLQLCSDFQAAVPGPGPALTLLKRVADYHAEKLAIDEKEAITAFFVEKVFSIYSGLPLFIVSARQTQAVSEIRDWFRERIIGQEAAIDAVVETITLFKAGLHDRSRPIGTLLFVGPTGVGKTELARALAKFLFGSEQRLLRFDLSEFRDYHAFELLVGDPKEPAKPARLIDPVRANPFQVILLDELEKAHSTVWDLLLQVLDAGRLTPPAGSTVNFSNTIIICTSNIGAREAASASIGFARQQDNQHSTERLQQALETTFRPEFLNRFQHIVQFYALSREQVSKIARLELGRVLSREGIRNRNLAVDIDNQVLDFVVQQGYDQRYGARALKREIQKLLIVPIATLLMERNVEPASIVKAALRDGHIRVSVIDTPQSRASKRERQPLRSTGGQRMTATDLQKLLDGLQQDCRELSHAIAEPELLNRVDQLEQQRRDHSTWQDPAAVTQLLAEQTNLLETINRLQHLREQIDNLQQGFTQAVTHHDFIHLNDDLSRLEQHYIVARRELLYLGSTGSYDALLEIAPLQASVSARALLYETYQGWADWLGLETQLICEPMQDQEPIIIALRGHYPYGYLRLEAGHHRVRENQANSVLRIRVIPWLAISEPVQFSRQQALKKQGQMGGRIRSRLSVTGSDLMLQNARSLAENHEFSQTIAPSWSQAPQPPETVIRRYDMQPFLLRDFLTNTSSHRADVLKPEQFHQLLCQRITLEFRHD